MSAAQTISSFTAVVYKSITEFYTLHVKTDEDEAMPVATILPSRRLSASFSIDAWLVASTQ